MQVAALGSEVKKTIVGIGESRRQDGIALDSRSVVTRESLEINCMVTDAFRPLGLFSDHNKNF